MKNAMSAGPLRRRFSEASKQGFIQIIVILILMLVIASLLGADLSSLYKNKTLRTNFSYVWQWIGKAWDQYILPYGGALGSFLMEQVGEFRKDKE